MKNTLILWLFFLTVSTFAQYNGTGSVTQGSGDTTAANIFSCTGGRPTNLGSITAQDSSQWDLPAANNYINSTFPNSYDLYNSCNGNTFPTAADAVAALNGNDIIIIDSSGELFTAYIFADNYFELYINGIPAGKDNVPYTPFNSSIVRFRVNRPFTIAMLLIDWEEHLGLGYETNNTYTYYAGDGGMVAVIKDANDNTVAITGNDWKAQTYYTAPIIDLNCPTESGNERLSTNCVALSTNTGAGYYGLHWQRPADWMLPQFNDTLFPSAYTYSNTTVGVNNKPAYTNFTDIFDDPAQDAAFIWSSNLVLDNEVLVRYTVNSTVNSNEIEKETGSLQLYPNPVKNYVSIGPLPETEKMTGLSITDLNGKIVYQNPLIPEKIDVSQWADGFYTVRTLKDGKQLSSKFQIQK